MNQQPQYQQQQQQQSQSQLPNIGGGGQSSYNSNNVNTNVNTNNNINNNNNMNNNDNSMNNYNTQQSNSINGARAGVAAVGDVNLTNNNNNNNVADDTFYSTGIPPLGNRKGADPDRQSIGTTQSKASKMTYSEYPQIRPTNPMYTSTNTIKTGVSAASRTSRASTMNTVSRRQKYNPNAPRRIHDYRWMGALAMLLFFPTGFIAIGLAFKARTKFADGFIDAAKKLNGRAFFFCVLSYIIGAVWLLAVFFWMDKWPRTNG